MTTRWRDADERGRILEKECDDFSDNLHMIDAQEDGAFRRWLLRGPGTWVEVVTLRGGIYVGGDVDTVVFRGGVDRSSDPRGRVYWMATRSYDYAAEKARIGDTAPDEWDGDCARGHILWHRKREQLNKDQARALWEILAHDDVSGAEFHAAIYEETNDSELCNMGDVTSHRVYMATAIMRRLAHLLDSRDMQQAARGWFLKTDREPEASGSDSRQKLETQRVLVDRLAQTARAVYYRELDNKNNDPEWIAWRAVAADIAEQLAWRDKLIAELQKTIARTDDELEQLRVNAHC